MTILVKFLHKLYQVLDELCNHQDQAQSQSVQVYAKLKFDL